MKPKTLRVCRRCKEKFDIGNGKYGQEGSKYYHESCWEEILSEKMLGLKPGSLSQTTAVKQPETIDPHLEYIYKIAKNDMHMTKTSVNNKLKQLKADGMSVQDVARGLRYYIEVIGGEVYDYGLWIAERYVNRANKYYEQLNRINLLNEKLIKGAQLSESERVEITFKKTKWKSSVKEISMD